MRESKKSKRFLGKTSVQNLWRIVHDVWSAVSNKVYHLESEGGILGALLGLTRCAVQAALIPSTIVLGWWAICGAVKIIAWEPRLWITGWLALFSPLFAIAVYSKFFYKDDEAEELRKSAFDAMAEANM